MLQSSVRYITILFFFCSGLLVSGETMDLDTAIQLALKHNIQIRRSELSLSLDKKKAETVWNNFIPAITAQGSTIKQYIPETDMTVAGSIGASLTLSPALVDSFAAIRYSLDKGELSLADAKRDIERSVRKSWYSLVIGKEQLTVLELSEKNTETSYLLTQEKYKAGLSSEIDLLNARIKAEEARLTRQSAEISHEYNKAVFSHLIGIESGTITEFQLEAFDTPEEISEFTFNEAANNSIRSLEKSLALARATRDATQKSAFLPYLSLGWTWDTTTTITNNTDWNDRASLTAAIGIRIDSFLPGSSARVQLAENDVVIQDTELQLSDTRNNVRLEAQRLMSSITMSQENLKGYKSTMAFAERSWNLTREAYSRGTRDLLTLQAAEQNLQEAQLQVLTQKKTILESIIDLEYLVDLPYGTLGGKK